MKKGLKNKITRATRNKMQMLDIILTVSSRKYEKEVIHAVLEMVDEGHLGISWDDYGNSYYKAI